MQTNGRVRTPPLSHYTDINRQHHSYASSSEDSYGRLQSHSRSESGTSQTNYDEPLASPPPRALMEEYTRPESNTNRLRRKSNASRSSIEAALDDPITMHLLLEDAVDDSQHFEILSPEALKALKKEQGFLSRRIESAKKKLLVESKVHNTTQSLQRLESLSGSKYNPPSSLGKRRSSGGSDMINGTTVDPAPVSKRCEELAQNIWRLERRQAELQDRRLSHIAGVLKLNYQSQSQNTTSQRSIGATNYEDEEDDDDEPQFAFMDGGMGSGETPPNLKPRLQTLSTDLYNLISQSGPYKKAGYTEPPQDSATADDELTYVEMGLSTVKGLHEGLVKYSEQSVEKVRRHEQTNAVLTGLWDVVTDTANDVKRSRDAVSGRPEGERGMEDEDSSDADIDEDEEFSVQAFASRVQHLCSRATTMAEQHQGLQQELAGHQATFSRSTNTLEDVQAQLTTSMSNLAAAEERAATHQASAEEASRNLSQLEAEREDMEAEIVRLQTEVTVARAELDGAYGTRAQRALEGHVNPETQRDLEELIAKNTDLMQQKAEIEQRVDVLQKELRELVTEYEGLVKQSVEAEKEREALEGLVDTLKERIEEVEVKLSDEKVKVMGLQGSKTATGEANRGTEMTSVGIMRSEFKKMMREARSEHFKVLKTEQEERRRLEATIRSLRKDPTAGGAPTLSPPQPLGKSGLSRAIAAP